MVEKTKVEFRNRATWLDLYDQENPNFAQYTNIPNLDQFVNDNQNELQELKKVSMVCNQLIKKFIEPAHD